MKKLMIGLIILAWSIELEGKGKKIYISSDMEGLAGVVTGEQLGPSGFEYQRFREFLTAEVNAAIEGAFEAGATEILVSDSHGNGQNILIEKLPKNVQVIRSWPRPLEMMEGIDDTFDGVIFLGYHSSTDNLEGVRAHTFSSTRFTSVKINGQVMTEGSWNAAIAGHFGVPVIMVSGDDAAVNEVQALVEKIEGAVVKENISFHSAKNLHPEAATDLIRSKSNKAVKNIKSYKPYKIMTPITVEISFKNYRPAQILEYLPLFERTSSHSIKYEAKNMIEASKIIVFILSYNGANSSP